ncbi:PP2C family protein-serine/threonine phosphatase [Seohaeicola nanhaiensis]|uniref:PP2C family protein-serine/threonine phosphatase n=1 Tax=Seohaeicola nanhaiensis TaxID=1387282 RepID=A0ABV9KG89_9RHOB
MLVVDDSRLQRRILASLLQKWGLSVIEAESGTDALAICEVAPPDLVLSDWMMPGMDGLDFCRAFRRLPAEAYGYFILLTSKSEKIEIAQGLDAGADDFLTKPVNPEELRARISAGDRILAMQRELSEKNRIIRDTLERLQAVYDSIDRDLKQARKIQQSLVPRLSQEFGSSHVGLLLKPCGHIGGDLVGMFSPRAGQLAVYSIDVSGHGITSAMMTARIGNYLSAVYFDQNLGVEPGDGGYVLRPPAAVAAELNARLMADTGIEEYFTMAYATVDLESGRLSLVQAGHPHPLLIRGDGRAEFVGTGGLPIGLLADAPFAQTELTLAPGDRLLLYSDGFTEARVRGGGMLDAQGLVDMVARCPPNGSGQEWLEDLFWDLTAQMDPDCEMEDDVSAALFEFNAG